MTATYVNVNCWTPGTYTVTWTASCGLYFPSQGACSSGPIFHTDCTLNDPNCTHYTTTFTVPPRKPTVNVKYDKDNNRLKVTYDYGIGAVGQLQLYADGNNDDAHPSAILNSIADCNHPSGVCYVAVAAPVCFHPHSYKAKIRACASDAWKSSGKTTVAALASSCIKIQSPCKPNYDMGNSCPISPNMCPGAPVNAGTGDVSLTIPLFTIAQSPLSLSFDLSYHSLAFDYPDAITTPFGKGWTHTFNASLRPTDPVNEPGRLVLLTPHGERYYFDQVTSSLWTAVNPGVRNDIVVSSTDYVLQFLDGSETHFDITTGRWLMTRDRWGNAITGTYSSGALETITDSAGRVVNLTYSAGALTAIQLPNGETWHFAYSNGELASITDPIHSGPWRTFSYASDSHNVQRLLSDAYDAGNVLLEHHDYDTLDRGTTSISAGGRDSHIIQYDTPGVGQSRITQQIDGATTRVATLSLLLQDGQYLPTEIDGACPSCGVSSDTQTFAYDDLNQVTSHMDGAGHVANYAWDGFGNLTSKTEGVGTDDQRTTTYEYNYASWPTFMTRSIEPAATGGVSTTTDYTWSGSGETSLATTTTGQLSGDDSSVSYTTTQMYDPKHRLTANDGPRTETGINDVTTYAYYDDADASANRRGRIDASGYERERRHQTYDLAGQKIEEQDQICTTPATTCTTWTTKRDETYVYNSLGRLAEVHHGGDAVLYTYDGDGLLTGVEDENHVAADPQHPDANTSYAYDALHRLQTVTQKLGAGTVVTSYEYDAQDNLSKVTDPNGNMTTYAYDDFHRLQKQTSPVTGVTTYAYDAAGNLTETSDANNAHTTRTYDTLSRVLSATSTNGATETVSWTYDQSAAPYGIGRLTAMTDPAGSTTYTYDRRGLLRTEQRALGGATYATSYTYDADANRTSIAHGGLTVNYTLDFAGRPIIATSGSTYWVWNATYLPFGPLSTLTYGNGATKTLQYDVRYRITENKLTNGSSTMADYAYATDANGNVTQIHDLGDATYNRDFGYDELNRLTTANTGTSLWQVGSYAYDAMGNLVSRSLGKTPPDDGTILSRRRANAHAVSGYVDTLTLQYQGTTPVVSVATTNMLDHTVTHDAAGNETQYLVTRTYSPRNLLATVTDTASEDANHRITYAYDGRGVRASRAETPTANGTSTRYYFYTPELQLLGITTDDSPNLWASRTRTMSAPLGMERIFVWFAGQPVGEYGPPRTADTSVVLSNRRAPNTLTTSDYFYTFTDHLGTPLLQMTNLTDVVWRAEYEPYGNIFAMRVGSRKDQPLRLPGQDAAMTWEGGEENYNIFRWYRAGWGRYTQVDPLPTRLGYISYGYVEGNPLYFVDPLGLTKVHVGPVLTFPTPTINKDCHYTGGKNPFSYGANLYGCTFFPYKINCSCSCCAAGGFKAHASIDIPQMNVFYATNGVNPNANWGLGAPVDPNLALSEELKHATIVKALVHMAAEAGDQLEAQTFTLKSQCVAACNQWKKSSDASINTFNDWVHQYNPHPW